MCSRKKIAAFTMMDVLTGMVVMSIVVVMVFYLLSATTKQAFHYQGTRVELNDYLLLRADLKRQVEIADRIDKVPGGFCLKNGQQSITYVQNGENLIRKSPVAADTLFHGVDQLVLTTVPVGLKQRDNETLVSSILLKLKYNEQLLTCYLYKDYGLTEPINQQLYREP